MECARYVLLTFQDKIAIFATKLFDRRKNEGILKSILFAGELCAYVAQLVERILGKDEVISSILIVGSIVFGRKIQDI